MHHSRLTIFIFIILFSCVEPELSQQDLPTTIQTPDWTDATHGKLDVPNFEVVFPDNNVLRIEISIDSHLWADMQHDLETNIDFVDLPPGGIEVDYSPIWVPCSIKFNNIEWYAVGIRYKGSSSLRAAFDNQTTKFPFKLDFDEFEDELPEIKNQRFFGFKQLNLSTNLGDGTFLREKVAADLFREFNVPAAHTAFAAVYLDIGSGPSYIGLYTLVEEVDDTVIDFQFSNGDGNLYKPEGNGATFAEGSFNEIEMNKKTNEEENDYSDVRLFYDVLHSSLRLSNPDEWKNQLESIFDVDHYLKYLAVNNTILNWDSYGTTSHNYFLYNHNGLLTWIPWDHNEALKPGTQVETVSLSTSEVDHNWPIIRYIMDVEEYKTKYDSYLRDFVNSNFEYSKMDALFSNHEYLIQEFGIQEAIDFNTNVNFLRWHAQKRNEAVKEYLEQ